MKIAVCFAGEIRTGVLASPNVLKFIGDLLPVTDFFVHTWTTNTSKCLHPGCSQNGLVTSATDIETFISIYNPKQFQIENHSTVYNSFYQPEWKNFVGLYGWNPHYYSWYRANQFKLQFEKDNNFKYDIVVKLRPDAIYSDNISLSKLIAQVKDNVFAVNNFGNTSIDHRCVEDIIFISSSAIMDNVSEWYKYLLEQWRAPDRIVPYENPHTILFDFIQSFGCKIHNFELWQDVGIYRYECLPFDPITDYLKCSEIDSIIYHSIKTFKDLDEIKGLTETELKVIEQKLINSHGHLPYFFKRINMKIAVLIAGEYREFALAHKLWTFLKWKNVDCYFSTWDTSKFLPPGGGEIIENISYDDIVKFIKPVAIDLASLKDPPQNQICYQGYLIDRWKSAISLMNNSGNHYDRVILLRPDLVLDYNEDIFHDFIITNISNDAHDILYAITGSALTEKFPLDKIRRMSDMIYVGTQQSISKILNIEMDIFSKGHMVDTHRYLAEQFLILYNEVRNMPIQWCIVRSNCRGLTNLDFHAIKLKSKEWWERRTGTFFNMGANHWEQKLDPADIPKPPVVRDEPPENLTSYNLWNKYNFKIFPEKNTSPFWKSPDDQYTFNKTKEDRNTKFTTYGEFDITYTYNSYGFRTNGHNVNEFEESYNLPTIMVGGCSITEGIGMPEHLLWYNTLVNQIRGQVRDIGPILVFNMAKGGISAAAAIRYIYVSIEHKGAKPDFVYLLLPPVSRKELVFSFDNETGYITNFLPGNPLTGMPNDHIVDFMQKNLDIRQSYHEYYQSLLFIKYYLKSKNIPWYFSCWCEDLSTVDYPSELDENYIPVIMQCVENQINPMRKFQKENIARDCAHPGPNSHCDLGVNIFDKLKDRVDFSQIFKKWKNSDK